MIIALATFGVICGGFFSAYLVILSGALFCIATPAEKPAPLPRTLLLMWCWLAVELIIEFFRLYDTPFSLADWYGQSPRLLRQAQIVAAFLLLNEVARRPASLARCLTWVPWAIGLSLTLQAAQMLTLFGVSSIPSFLSFNLNSFFAQQMRVPGVFSDPNSAGIALAGAGLVFFSLSVGRVRWWMWSLAVMAGLFATGSRSGLLVIVLFLVIDWVQRSKSLIAHNHTDRAGGTILKKQLILCGVTLGLAVVTINFLPLRVIEGLPAGVERLALSVRADSFEEASFSRVALWRIAFAQWTHAPVLGVGLDRYRELQPPFAQALGIDIGAWNDNAGSWPIFLVTELGLIGLLVFLLDISRLRLNPEHLKWSLPFIVVLLFGCHTHDPLCASIYGAICAYCLSERPMNEPHGSSAFGSPAQISLLLAPFIAIVALGFPRGVFAWEMHGGMLMRWTGGVAQIPLDCMSAGPIMKAAPPAFASQTVRITSVAGEKTQNSAQFSDTRLAGFVCSLDLRTGRRFVDLAVSPTIQPAAVGLGTDQRALGVLLAYPTPIALDDL